jgi:hypothetical protein
MSFQIKEDGLRGMLKLAGALFIVIFIKSSAMAEGIEYLGSIPMDGEAGAVFVEYGTAYVADGQYGVKLVDVTDIGPSLSPTGMRGWP